MILSPLGALLMRDLHISASRFGLVVSVYAFSAGVSGFLAAGFADRFDRKKMLMFFYSGFLVGTLLCGIAPPYHFLLFARMVTGLFGGVIGSISFAIIADLFPFNQRGRVMGVVQTSFAASQVLGLPLGLYLSRPLGLARAVPDDRLVLDGRRRPHRHLHEADRRAPQAAAPGGQRARPPDQDRVARPATCAPSRPRRCW